MKILLLTFTVVCARLSVQAITNAQHALGCEHETIKLSCKNGKVINILDGNYGRTTASSCEQRQMQNVSCYQDNSVAIVTDLCEGKTECTLKAENQVFGDPCPGTVKYLFVLYHCVDIQEFKYALSCENKPVHLECDPGKVIQVFAANYGRRSQITCAEGPIKSTNCLSEYAMNIISELCRHKRSCVVIATNNIFGDPCHGTYKYLSVKYKCVPGPDDCCTRQASNLASRCLDGSIILPSLLCDGKKDCPNGDDELMCSYDSKHICENGNLEIKCRKGEIIKIINANYGRISNKICPQKDIKENMNCRSENSRSVVQLKCEGKQKCEVKASNSIFDDPCPGVVKYLEVQYDCEPGVGSHKIIPRSLD